MAISYAITEENWIKVFDATHNMISQISAVGFRLVGVSKNFFVTVDNDGWWFKTFDQDCNLIAEMCLPGDELHSVTDDIITMRRTWEEYFEEFDPEWNYIMGYRKK